MVNTIDVIISHGADLATTTRAAIATSTRSGKPTRVRWGRVAWEVLPDDTVARGIERFHAAARSLRETETPQDVRDQETA